MWVAYVLNASGFVEPKIYLKGPICKVGRKVDNCLSFPDDQSISRVHAEIHIENSRAYLKDLNSKFGTNFVYAGTDQSREVSNSLTEIVSGQLVFFGKVSSTVKFVNEDVSFCVTRLDKIEKEKVKFAASALGGKVLQSPDNATHIVTNSISGATAKILAAIVFKKSIVTTEWLDFANTLKPSVLIPPTENFFPALEGTSAVRLINHTASRSNLLEGFTIISSSPTNEQYASLIKGCGAILIAAYTQNQEEIITALTNISETNKKTICMFCDDYSNSDTCPPGQEVVLSGILYLQASQLATSIFENTKPLPTANPPAIKMTASQRLNTQNTQSQMLDLKQRKHDGHPSVDALAPAAIPLVKVKKETAKKTKPEKPEKQPCKETIAKPIILSFAASTSPGPVQVPVLVQGPGPVPVGKKVRGILTSEKVPAVASQRVTFAEPMDVLGDDVDLTSQPPSPVRPAMDIIKKSSGSGGLRLDRHKVDPEVKNTIITSSSSSSNRIVAKLFPSDELCGDDPKSVVVAVNPESSAILNTKRKLGSEIAAEDLERSHKKTKLTVQHPSDNPDTFSASAISARDVSGHPHRSEEKTVNPPEGDVNDFDNAMNSDNCLENSDRSVNNSVNGSASDGDWFTAVEVSQRQELLKHKNKSYKTEFENMIEGGIPLGMPIVRPEALVVVRDLMLKKISRDAAADQSAQSTRNPRDVRRFFKNLIRVVCNESVLMAKNMESVLPKESEREIQLRLDADAAEAREQFAAQLFEDRFLPGGAAPKKRNVRAY